MAAVKEDSAATCSNESRALVADVTRLYSTARICRNWFVSVSIFFIVFNLFFLSEDTSNPFFSISTMFHSSTIH